MLMRIELRKKLHSTIASPDLYVKPLKLGIISMDREVNE
jgi:hypothetical protein